MLALQTDPTAFARTYQEDANLPDSAWQERLESSHLEQESIMLFAQSEHRLIGMVGALLRQGSCVGHSATVVSMYVNCNFRGRSVGSNLLSALLDKLAARNILQVKIEVLCSNTSAIKIYEKVGAKIVGVLEKELCHNGIYYDSYLMIKLLK